MLTEPRVCVHCTLKAAAHAAERTQDRGEDVVVDVLLSMFVDMLYRLDRVAMMTPSKLQRWQRHFERCLREDARTCDHILRKDVDNSIDREEPPF